jgi:hypothetical protein
MCLTEEYLIQIIFFLAEWNMLIRAAHRAVLMPATYESITQGQCILLQRLTVLTPPASLQRLHTDLLRMAETCLVLKAHTLGDDLVFTEMLAEFEEAIQTIYVELYRLQHHPGFHSSY